MPTIISININLLGMALMLLNGLRIRNALKDRSETDGIGKISIILKWLE